MGLPPVALQPLAPSQTTRGRRGCAVPTYRSSRRARPVRNPGQDQSRRSSRDSSGVRRGVTGGWVTGGWAARGRTGDDTRKHTQPFARNGMHSVESGGPMGKPNGQAPGAPAPGPWRYPALVVTVLITLGTLAAAPRIASGPRDEREAEQRARPRMQSSGVPLPTALTPILVVAAIMILRTRRRTAKLIEDTERSRLALARASEHKVALLRGLTHDLGNTLVAAAGYTSLLRDEITGPLAPEQREQMQRIGRLIAQAISIVGDS